MVTKKSDIKIRLEKGKLCLSSPYNPDINGEYRGLNGRWRSAQKEWEFPARVLEELRDRLNLHFGYDDRPYQVRDVRVNLGGWGACSTREFSLFGRKLLTRPGRDEPVRMAPGVRLIEGNFDPSPCGSVQSPKIGDFEGVVIEVRDVPTLFAQTFAEEDEDITLVDEPEPGEDAVALLLAEREQLETHKATLEAEILRIDAELAALDAPQ